MDEDCITNVAAHNGRWAQLEDLAAELAQIAAALDRMRIMVDGLLCQEREDASPVPGHDSQPHTSLTAAAAPEREQAAEPVEPSLGWSAADEQASWSPADEPPGWTAGERAPALTQLPPAGRAPDQEWSAGDPAAESTREEVRRLVEEARAEMEDRAAGVARSGRFNWSSAEPRTWAPEQQAPASASQEESQEPVRYRGDDDEDGERVGRIVETARTGPEEGRSRGETPSDTPRLHALDPKPEVQRRPPAPSAQEVEQRLLSLSTTLMVEDPSGRVELVRIYDMLSRLRVPSAASLTNYLPHSVTVTLDGPMPAEEEVRAAATAAFGRDCRTITDAGRVIVRLAERDGHAA